MLYEPNAKEVQVKLDNDEIKTINLKELSLKQTDKAWELIYVSFVNAILTTKDMLDRINNGENIVVEVVEEMDKNNNKALNDDIELWKLISGEDDVSWISHMYSSSKEKVLEDFFKINPDLEKRKKNFEEMLMELSKQ